MADAPDLPPLPSDSAPAAPRPAAPSPPSRWAGVQALWTLVVRLLLLGAGIGLGWLVGLLVAQVLPSRNPNPPLTEEVLRSGSRTTRKLRQLPRWWQDDGAGGGDGLTLTAEAEPGESAAGGGEAEAEPAPVPEAERDRLQSDLTALRQDLASLNTRLADLETTVGTPPAGTFEDRLQRLDQRLETSGDGNTGDGASGDGNTDGSAAPESAAAESDPSTAAPGARIPYREPRFPLVRDRVILPSALLFEPNSSILTASGQQLLDSIASDLRRYGTPTLLVGSHTDGAASPEQASQLTLQQAVAVQQYLAPQLEAEGIRWVPVGYGQTRPTTADTTAAAQQRNQRVEIGIVPGD
ncbi:OmpA family protein [Nodosilinea sp. PGN35]|uniref:OmpA family protein n=1 Tax=Nodosilinea sp. PGN35 TaxID=3020489 RepID=UPI0023B2C936|nr:OmpA family protein [Nodosilinea sp. TSF1-S3]MDF0364891.1 OmpA family protein [Nodosilinea sp. TSF1-S3]